MARATRIALDLALVSLRTVGPVFSNLWSATKRLLINTPAKPLVCNPIIRKAETTLDKISLMLVSRIEAIRDRQLPLEMKYLEKEIERIKKKIDQKGDSASKSLKPAGALAWRYAKVEMIPPMTHSFFHGPGGKKMEDYVSKLANNVIAGLEGRIREIEAEKERQIKEKEAAIKAAHEKVKAEAKRKEELRLKEEAEKKAKEAKQATKEKVEKKAEVKAEAKTDKPKAKASKKVAKKVKKKQVKKPKPQRISKTPPESKK